jgi:RHS repeat-associated protein
MGCLKLTYYENETPLKVVQGNFLSEKKSCAGDYRYGFNGKEKDSKGEWGSTHYDYGFRIYKPSIGRFLSVDPLTKSYPMLTPYQFASNTPIVAIDLDGLEAIITITGHYWQNQINKAVKADDVERAGFLAFEAVITGLSDLKDDKSRSWAVRNGGWVDGRPAKLSYGDHTGLIVQDGEGNRLFKIDPPTQEDNGSSIFDGFVEAWNLLMGSSSSESGGTGFTFVTSDGDMLSLATQPIYHVRSGASEGAIDISGIMRAIGAVGTPDPGRGAPAFPSKDVSDVLEGVKMIVDAHLLQDDIHDQGEFVEIEEERSHSFDSCGFCHQIGPKNSMKTKEQGGPHSGPILSTKSKKKE